MAKRRMTVEQALKLLNAANMAELARRLGTTRQVVGHWKHGKYKGIPRWWERAIREMAQ